jgi:hypothetical protein
MALLEELQRKKGLGSLLPGKGRPIRFLPTIPPGEEPRGPGGPRPPGTSLADKIRMLQMQKQRLAEQLRRIEIQLQQLMSGGGRPPWEGPEPPRPFPGNGDTSPVGPVMPAPTPVGPITPIGPGTPQPPPPKPIPPWGG